MNLSNRVRSIQPSATLAITAKAKQMKAQGLDTVSFSAGEPDFPPPEPVRRAAMEAVEKNRSKYAPAAGLPELRQAIARKLEKDNGLSYEPGQVVVTVGAKQALYNALQALVDPGDEVIVLAPYWVSYPEQVKAAEGVPVIVPTTAGFRPDAGALEKAFSARTRALIVNSPSNPTGAVFARGDFEVLTGLLAGHPDVTLISDEIYEKLLYDGAVHLSPAGLPGMMGRTVVVNGFSKSHAVPGWRVGYAAGPEEIIGAMARLQGHATSNAPSLVQYAMLAACEMDDAWFEDVVGTFTRRRDRMVGGLSALPGFRVTPPQGAFYAFADISDLLPARLRGRELKGSVDFASALLDEEHVAVIPGLPFGAENHIRLSYAASEEDIGKGLDRMAAFVGKLERG